MRFGPAIAYKSLDANKLISFNINSFKKICKIKQK